MAAGGTLNFSTASGPIAGCTGVALQNGVAQCTATIAQAGTVNVSYSGDAGTAAESASLVLNPGKAQAGIYVESASTVPVLGQAVTVDVRLAGPLGFPAPTGTVTFTDSPASGGAVSLGNASVGADGHALLVLQGSLALGPHTILAGYSGDTNYGPCTALPVSITVEPDPTLLVVASPPAQIGQPVTLNAAVS